ncbi:MAG: HAD-IC family P-type ATPase, partial [Saprospiraceae bacterium]
MQHKINLPANLTGLSDAEVLLSQKVNGLNQQQSSDRITTWSILVDLLKEPMLILLIIVTVIYFLLNQYDEAYFMLGAILIVTGISFYQDNRSRKALESLQALNTPVTHVIRNSVPITINSTDIVPGDLVIIEEGGLINADGVVVYSHDFSVNESSLTGEASSIFKNGSIGNDKLYSGTIASSGLAIFKVEQTGVNTKLGRIGKSLMEIKDESSPLQLQIRSFVRKMTFIGILVFLMVWLISFLKNHDWLEGLLKGLTLAMSILPEEIPVAFATFIALGSRRLVRDGILVKKTRVVETLGGATIICTDKTGTITENRMGLQCIYAHRNKQLSNDISNLDNPAKEVIETSMWSSEPIPFDPMEKTIHEVYEKNTQKDKRTEYTMIHEYPLGGKPPMM